MELVEKIMKFKVVCHGDDKLFMQKMRRENGWSRSFSEQAFYEYKRFICLVTMGQQRVVPSRVIDKVWHLHLTFTRSYWSELCGNIVKNDIHHTPSLKTLDSKSRDYKDYKDTIALYKTVFISDPPLNCWPLKEKNKRNYWMLIPFVTSATFLTACTSFVDDDAMFYVKWAIGIYAAYYILKWIIKYGGSGGSSCSSCSGGCGGD